MVYKTRLSRKPWVENKKTSITIPGIHGIQDTIVPEHTILIPIAYTPKPYLNANTDVSSEARSIIHLGLSRHRRPFSVYASSERSDGSAQVRRTD